MSLQEPRTQNSAPGEAWAQQADAVVVLLEAGLDAGVAAFWRVACAHWSQWLPVYVVRPILAEDAFEIHGEGERVVELRVSSPPAAQTGRLVARQLCVDHCIRPIVVTDSPAAYAMVGGRYAALTVFLETGARGASPWQGAMADEVVQAAWSRLLHHADLAICSTEEAFAYLDRAAWFQGERVSEPGLACLPPAGASVSAPASPETSLPEPFLAGHVSEPETAALVSRLCEVMTRCLARGARGKSNQRKLNLLVLYDDFETNIATLRDYLESYSLYSRNHVVYAPATREALPPSDLSMFDAVVFHYSVRMCHPSYFSLAYASAVQDFDGYKILYMQDEYEITEQSRTWMEDLGIHCLFTCVPEEYIDVVYPRKRFPHVDFRRVFTGYVPAHLENRRPFRPMAEREVVLGYRGRALPYWYGNLGQDKLNIGVRMREICEARGVPCDIEWEYEKRLFGDAWFDFHLRCKAMLATESGANVFDEEGDLRKQITAALEENPDLSYEEAFERFLRPHEGKVRMGQVSPRLFEAMALGTALVLFEGRYDDILVPDVHYIQLNKDYGNVDAVLEKLADDEFLTRMVERCYQDIVESGRYSYRRFIADFDDYLSSRLGRGKGYQMLSTVVGYRDEDGLVHAAEIGYPRGYASDQILYFRRDDYIKEPVEHQFYRFKRKFGQEDATDQDDAQETPPRPKRILLLPGATWVDQRICKPFNRFWEYHRCRLVDVIWGSNKE